ncbi:magnesium transporter [Acidobacteria bacterium Mor1]|nr:magnesium transporter [Acidobacteria bacterium Mor1]
MSNVAYLLQPEIEEALRERSFGTLREMLLDWPPQEVAEMIDSLAEEDRAVLFRLLPREHASDTFEYLPPDSQELLIRGLGREQVAYVLNDMSPDDRTAMLEELPAAVTVQALTLLAPEERVVARQLLGYPEDSIGRLMTPDKLAVRLEWTVQQVLDHIREHGDDSETLNIVYVVDERGKLIDDLRIRELLVQPTSTPISEIADGKFVALTATDDQEEAIKAFADADRVALPVTDSTGVLLGIVTVDDVLDVVEEEATEDIQKIGGSAALEQPYMQVSFPRMFRKRAVWLVALFLGQLLTLNAMAAFDDLMAVMPVLVLFVPLIISSGGNSGAQAATLVVRAIALDEVSSGDWWKVMQREILFGISLGILLSGIGIARVFFGDMFGEQYDNWLRLALAVGASLICVVLWGVVVGSMLPLLLKRLNLDPATSSTPFVTTVVDITGLLIYFTVSATVLGLA